MSKFFAGINSTSESDSEFSWSSDESSIYESEYSKPNLPQISCNLATPLYVYKQKDNIGTKIIFTESQTSSSNKDSDYESDYESEDDFTSLSNKDSDYESDYESEDDFTSSSNKDSDYESNAETDCPSSDYESEDDFTSSSNKDSGYESNAETDCPSSDYESEDDFTIRDNVDIQYGTKKYNNPDIKLNFSYKQDETDYSIKSIRYEIDLSQLLKAIQNERLKLENIDNLRSIISKCNKRAKDDDQIDFSDVDNIASKKPLPWVISGAGAMSIHAALTDALKLNTNQNKHGYKPKYREVKDIEEKQSEIKHRKIKYREINDIDILVDTPSWYKIHANAICESFESRTILNDKVWQYKVKVPVTKVTLELVRMDDYTGTITTEDGKIFNIEHNQITTENGNLISDREFRKIINKDNKKVKIETGEVVSISLTKGGKLKIKKIEETKEDENINIDVDFVHSPDFFKNYTNKKSTSKHTCDPLNTFNKVPLYIAPMSYLTDSKRRCMATPTRWTKVRNHKDFIDFHNGVDRKFKPIKPIDRKGATDYQDYYSGKRTGRVQKACGMIPKGTVITDKEKERVIKTRIKQQRKIKTWRMQATNSRGLRIGKAPQEDKTWVSLIDDFGPQ